MRDVAHLPPLVRTVHYAVERRAWAAGGPIDDFRRTDWLIAEVGKRQHGVVATGQLLALGVTAKQIKVRRARGRLHPVHRGVWAVGQPTLSLDGRRHAAMLRAGADACFSHQSSGVLLAVRKHDTGRLELSVPTNAGRGPTGLILHRTASLGPIDRTVVDGFPCTTLARTFVDLAGVLTPAQLRWSLREADYTGRLDVAAITVAASRIDRPRGVRTLRRLLLDHEDVPGVPFSVMERRYRRLCREFGLAVGEPQAKVDGTSRRPDVRYREAGVVVELDGRAAHERLAAIKDDHQRDLELLALGLVTVRLVPTDLEGTARPRTATQVRAALAAQLARRASRTAPHGLETRRSTA